MENGFRFSSKYADDELESPIYYYGYRYYAPELGRWLTRDPLGEASFLSRYAEGKSLREKRNLFLDALKPAYVFSRNDPVDRYDLLGLRILLETHPVALGIDHSKITIIPDCQANWIYDYRFAPNMTPRGLRYATIGAGSVNGFLVWDVNRPRDVNRFHNVYSEQINPPAGMSEDDFIRLLFAAVARYANNLDYELFPLSITDGYNSNSFVSGLLGFLLGNAPAQPPDTPGYGKPVPPGHFR